MAKIQLKYFILRPPRRRSLHALQEPPVLSSILVRGGWISREALDVFVVVIPDT